MRPPYIDPTANAPQRALVADDEPRARELLGAQLRARGYEVATAAGAEEAIDALENFAPHLVLADVELPDGDRPLIAAVIEHAEPPAALILLARREQVPAAIRGLAAGADGYLTKPVEAEQLHLVAQRIIDHRRLRARVDSMRARLMGNRSLRRLVGESAAIHAVRDALAQAAETRAPVLISGENGSGRLLAAELLHECRGTSGPFVPAPCAALSTVELERALKRAHRGTLFLDEIADLPADGQETLAEFLTQGGGPAEGTGERRQRPRVCVVASTGRDLAALADGFEFSDELLQAVRGTAVAMPPLRDRRSDIPLLVDHFLRQREASAEAGAERLAGGVDGDTMARLQSYGWPGNVAELKRFLAQSAGTFIR